MDDPPTTETLSRAADSTRAVLARVRHQLLDASTPCASWDVRALINHFVGVPRRVGALLTGEDADIPEDFATGDLVASYDESLKVALRAFQTPGALEKKLVTPFGEAPGVFMLGMVTADQFVHGWDLARATGQDTKFDSELAAALLARARKSITEEFRGADGKAPFGPVVEAPAGATAADELAAFYGRQL